MCLVYICSSDDCCIKLHLNCGTIIHIYNYFTSNMSNKFNMEQYLFKKMAGAMVKFYEDMGKECEFAKKGFGSCKQWQCLQ